MCVFALWHLPAHLLLCSNSGSTEMILMKFNTGKVYYSMSTSLNFGYNRTKIAKENLREDLHACKCV
jgi:hypothetical protein